MPESKLERTSAHFGGIEYPGCFQIGVKAYDMVRRRIDLSEYLALVLTGAENLLTYRNFERVRNRFAPFGAPQ